MLSSKTQALVNTVNTVGVMGKGIALQFKERFPNNFLAYSNACKNKELVPGKLLVYIEKDLKGNETIIINFPTKTVWYQKSKYEYIEEGLKELINVILKYKIKSISLPPLGCGNGGLKWSKVKELIEKYLSSFNSIDIRIYEPNEAVKEILKKQEINKANKLTPARAMLLYAMFYYESQGEKSSVFVANKLAYFLQRSGESTFNRTAFVACNYGPYSVGIGHMLYELNGKYIRGLEQLNTKAFEEITLNYETASEISTYIKSKLSKDQIQRLSNVLKLIEGFQSAYSLEILASVDFILKSNPQISLEDTILKIQQWSDRKKNLFKEKHIQIAYEHLKTFSKELPFEKKKSLFNDFE